MNLLPKNIDGCPYLFLAPMEGVGDHCFRKAMASIGGFDEGVRDFLRVPANAYIPHIAAAYNSSEISPLPLACQLMGSDPYLMSLIAQEIEKKGAPRIDLNCGCPSNTVTGKGAGSSLLKNPELLYRIAKSLVDAVSIPVTAKLRSGFADTVLFRENLLAAQESGVKFITLHPRTKVDGYHSPARWELIAEAKELLSIPIVGNGDIYTVVDALNMLQQTHCDALMIGRGAVINPFIFHEIKDHFSQRATERTFEKLKAFFRVYLSELPELPEKSKVNKMKQLMSYLFKGNQQLLEKRQTILSSQFSSAADFLNFAFSCLQEHWEIINR